MTYYQLLELKHSYYAIITSLLWNQRSIISNWPGASFVKIEVTPEEELMLSFIKAIKDYEELVNNNEFIFRLCDMLEGLVNRESIEYCTHYDLERAKKIINEVHKYKGVISSII